MKKLILLLAFTIGYIFTFAQDITVLFAGYDAHGNPIHLDSIRVINLTKGQEDVIKDTVVVFDENGDVTTGINHFAPIDEFKLSQNIPNPFDGITKVSMQLPSSGKVIIDVYDITGKKVTTYRNTLSAGTHSFKVALRTSQSYLLTVRCGGKTSSIKMLNSGRAGENAIYYEGMSSTNSISKLLKSTTEENDNEMMYIGYATINGKVFVSDTIRRDHQYTETIPIIFSTVGIPEIGKTIVSNITATSAIFTGKISFEGTDSFIARGFCWSTNDNPTIEDSLYYEQINNVDSFSTTILNLKKNTTYYVRTFATDSTETYYGEETSFTTLDYTFEAQIKWQTEKYTGDNDPYSHGRSIPLVGDVDGDGEIEIVVPCSVKNAGNNNSALRPNTFITNNLNVINGKTGELKYTIKTCDYQVYGQPIAMADVNKDGKAEIFILSIGKRISTTEQKYADKNLYCYDISKANTDASDYLWKDTNDLKYTYLPMIADINNDSIPEVVCGPNVFNAITGKRIIAGTFDENGMGFGGSYNIHGSWNQAKAQELSEQYYLNTLADIDGDGDLELCAGNTVYDIIINDPNNINGNQFLIKSQCETGVLPYEDMYDGQTFVTDFDNDGDLDICVIGRNKNITIMSGNVNHNCLYVWEGQTNKIIGYFAFDPKANSLGIPAAADIDGDGFPEVIVNGWVYGQNYGASAYPDQIHILKFSNGFVLDSISQAQNIQELFTRELCQEFYENSSVTTFDFNKDGKAEIVFKGEKGLFILDGTTLKQLCKYDISATTGSEYAIVADVDQDGYADIIFTDEYNPSKSPAGGVTVLESKKELGVWAPARKVWNQTPYNAINIIEDLTVPQYQIDISKKKALNGFLMQTSSINE